MTTAEIKLDLFRKLNSLKGTRLEEAYGVLINFINSKNENPEWDLLPPIQQEAILKGINQLNNGEGKEHKNVMNTIRKNI